MFISKGCLNAILENLSVLNREVNELKKGDEMGMCLPEKLATLTLDVATGQLMINGNRMKDITHLQLTFDCGEWDLVIRQHKFYGASGKAASKDTAKKVKE